MLQKSIKLSLIHPLWFRTTEAFGNIVLNPLETSFEPFSTNRRKTTKDLLLSCMTWKVFWITAPFTVVSDNLRDLEHLTSNHLLLLKSDSPMPPGTFQREDLFSCHRLCQAQYLAHVFWKRCSHECLPLLQIPKKWQYPHRNLTVGDIVLVATKNTSRNQFPRSSEHPNETKETELPPVEEHPVPMQNHHQKLVLLLLLQLINF